VLLKQQQRVKVINLCLTIVVGILFIISLSLHGLVISLVLLFTKVKTMKRTTSSLCAEVQAQLSNPLSCTYR
jgi:hypothetical protein